MEIGLYCKDTRGIPLRCIPQRGDRSAKPPILGISVDDSVLLVTNADKLHSAMSIMWD
jgi:hypothetical protein